MNRLTVKKLNENKHAIRANTGENPINEIHLNKKLILDLDFFRYPDPLCQALRERLTKYTGFSPNNIMCTNGSDEALILLIRLFTAPEEEVILCPPTFSMFEFYAKFARASVVSVVRNNDFSLNIDKILSSITKNTKMIILDSPGNPCGATIPIKDIKTLLTKEITVVIDEAYFEYCGETATDLICIYPNLVVTRTFSKWAGLAGLRVGYVIANENVIERLMKIKLPYSVNSVGQYFASFVLDHKDQFLKRLGNIILLRELAIKNLDKFSEITVYSSKTAYVVIKLNAIGSSRGLKKFLENNNIFIKLIDQPLLENSIRVNFGTEKEINSFCSSLEFWLTLHKQVKKPMF